MSSQIMYVSTNCHHFRNCIYYASIANSTTFANDTTYVEAFFTCISNQYKQGNKNKMN